jgi:hypothetical protein
LLALQPLSESKINVNPFDNRIALRTIGATAPGACQHHLDN